MVLPPLRISFAGWADHVHLERWAGYFARAGHEVGVLSFSDAGHYPAGVSQATVRFTNRGAFWHRLHLRWLLACFRPQIVHVHWAAFAHHFVDLWPGPFVVTAWGSDVYRLAEQPSIVRAEVRRGFERANAITCDSEDLAAAIRRLAPSVADRIFVVQWGVDTDAFSPAVDTMALEDELAVTGRPVVFSARNFLPIYNQDVVLRAFAMVRSAVPMSVLIMKNYNGQPEYVQAMRNLIADLDLTDSVRIVDSLPYERMPALYAVAQATVSVPSSDATPMALLEAMASGSVPICSDLPSLREWIRSGDNGFLVDAGDVAGLAESVIRTLRDKALRDSVASANRLDVENRASQRYWMGQAESIYRNVLRQQRS